MSNVAHSSAFLWAYGFHDGRADLVTDQTLAARLDEADDWVWLHFPLSDQRARSFIQGLRDVPEEARELILAAEERVQIQFAGDWAFGVLPDFQRDLEGRALDVGRLQFALSGRRLITARRHALQIVDDLRRKAAAGMELDCPAEAWGRLVERFVDLSEARLHDLAGGLGGIEDRMLAEGADLGGLSLGPVRRELSRHHREFLALRSALNRAMAPRSPHRVARISDQLPRLAHEVEDLDREAAGLQERARLLHEEIDTKITSATNRSMRTLTILSTLLIPPTLVTGAFGMNVTGVPFETGRGGFVLASIVCLAVVASAYLLLRRWRIL